mmetsp:Transcript_25263/g.59878  ORF Transcript_25263/g.59878 Transcript_25263/m.59878 type:complete len:318 (+) Transcript_25263:619-1572(+)|eukprot:CAMPEP_0113477112 /NCGR_PEP_ID=MMETSP0014_2-20120614/20032_1 /TAXON_ID=2857 /ORGANISM="Nitzschia sp." /LENGTH=317 /DNA_ID=CAMNT_0000370181 /DNA_START=611 /DNA_END=1564 /DNA_ORIENTATION=+ /assembly_acc=CAM_ASM_000159
MGRNYRGRGGGRARGQGSRRGGSKPERSENLKDPVNYYSLGSTTSHLVEMALITQVILSHLQKTLKNGKDLVKALKTGKEFNFDEYKPTPVIKPEPNNEEAMATGAHPTYNPLEYARYEQEKDIQSRKIDAWIEREETYEENKVKAFQIILGQCTDRLVEKIKNQTDYETRVMYKPMELLKDIKKLSVSHTDDKYDMSMLHDAMRSFCNLYQSENESLSQYTLRFTATRDVLTNYLGQKIDLTQTPSAKKNTSTANVPTVDGEWNRFCAYMYMAHAQKQKYGLLLQDMENDAVRNKNRYIFPKTIPEAEHLLREYKR